MDPNELVPCELCGKRVRLEVLKLHRGNAQCYVGQTVNRLSGQGLEVLEDNGWAPLTSTDLTGPLPPWVRHLEGLGVHVAYEPCKTERDVTSSHRHQVVYGWWLPNWVVRISRLNAFDLQAVVRLILSDPQLERVASAAAAMGDADTVLAAVGYEECSGRTP